MTSLHSCTRISPLQPDVIFDASMTSSLLANEDAQDLRLLSPLNASSSPEISFPPLLLKPSPMGAPREITLEYGFMMHLGSGTSPACCASLKASSSASLRSSLSCFSLSCFWRSFLRSASIRLCSSSFLLFTSASLSSVSIVRAEVSYKRGMAW